MGYEDDIADRDLPPEAAAALAEVVGRSVAAATALLADAAPGEPMCAACLYYQQVEDEADFGLPTIALVSEAHRRAALADHDAAEAFARVFNPEHESGPWLDAKQPAIDAPARLLAQALMDDGVLDPQRFVLCRVARALTTGDVPRQRTDDFLAYVFDAGFDAVLVENLRFAATPSVTAAWEALGLLPRRSSLELEGDVPLEEVVADIQEEVDDELTRFLGRFSVECHAPGGEEGLWDVPLDEAIAWARRHTDVIRVRVGEETFTAGPQPIAGLPEWPEGRTVTDRPIG